MDLRKSEPYFQFSGGKVSNRSYGKVDDYEWERQVPKNLHARVNLNYAIRNAAWAGGPVRDEQLPSEMYVDYVRFLGSKKIEPHLNLPVQFVILADDVPMF